MLLKIELTEQDLRKLVLQRVEELLEADIDPQDVKIEVKSKQNYRSEWEAAAFRAVVVKNQ